MKGSTCSIEGRQVSRAEFDRLLKTLKETDGWYCAETTTGGETGWNAEDPQGVQYRYAAVTDGDKNTQTLERLR